MAMSTRGQTIKRKSATAPAGKTSKKEVLAPTSVSKNKKCAETPARSPRAEVEPSREEEGPVVTTRSSKPYAKPSSSKENPVKTVSKRSSSIAPAASKPSITRVVVSAQSKTRGRRPSPAPTPLEDSNVAEHVAEVHVLKRKRQSLDEEISSFREECQKEERALKKQKIALDKQEKQLKNVEEKLNVRSDHLDEREVSVRLREEEVLRCSTNAVEMTLKQMEECFTCTLCYEIMASPTVLTSSSCGHTFCSLCILKWFFTNLHTDCRSWHSRVECPICRSPLQTPVTSLNHRLIDSFPFAPNRLVENVLDQLMESIATPPGGQRTVSGKGRKKKVVIDVDDPVLDWRQGGSARKDWSARDKAGKRMRQELAQKWDIMTQEEFLRTKQSLGVA